MAKRGIDKPDVPVKDPVGEGTGGNTGFALAIKDTKNISIVNEGDNIENFK